MCMASAPPPVAVPALPPPPAPAPTVADPAVIAARNSANNVANQAAGNGAKGSVFSTQADLTPANVAKKTALGD